MAGLFPPGLLPCELTLSVLHCTSLQSVACLVLRSQRLPGGTSPKYGGAPGVEQQCCGSQTMGPCYLSIVLTSFYSDRLAELASPWQGPWVCSHPTVTQRWGTGTERELGVLTANSLVPGGHFTSGTNSSFRLPGASSHTQGKEGTANQRTQAHIILRAPPARQLPFPPILFPWRVLSLD